MAILSHSILERASVQAAALANLIDGLVLDATDPSLVAVLTVQSTKVRAVARIFLRESLQFRKADLDTRLTVLATEAADVAAQIHNL